MPDNSSSRQLTESDSPNEDAKASSEYLKTLSRTAIMDIVQATIDREFERVENETPEEREAFWKQYACEYEYRAQSKNQAANISQGGKPREGVDHDTAMRILREMEEKRLREEEEEDDNERLQREYDSQKKVAGVSFPRKEETGRGQGQNEGEENKAKENEGKEDTE